MPTIRVYPGKDNTSPITVIGETFAPVQGTHIDVADFVALNLEANGYVRAAEVGATAQRPSTPSVGYKYIDTTLNAVIFWDGTVWRNLITGASV